MIKNISEFVSKSEVRKEISGVYIMPDRIVATDSFKLIEKKCDTGASEPFIVKLPKGVRKLESVKRTEMGAVLDDVRIAEVIEGEYPKYEKIIPTGVPLASIKLSARHLRAVCDAFVGADEFDEVTIEIREGLKPLVFTNEKAGLRSILAPMAK